MRELLEIAGEGDGAGGHAAGLDDEQQSPSVDEGQQRVVRLAQVRVLPADPRPASRELGVNEGAGERDEPAHGPGQEDLERSVDAARDHRRVHEDAGADDPSHHDHRGIEEAEPPQEDGGRGGRRRGAGLGAGHGPRSLTPLVDPSASEASGGLPACILRAVMNRGRHRVTE